MRPARADDYEALVALAVACADTGKLHVAPEYLRNPVEAWTALKPALERTVAESSGGLVGAAPIARLVPTRPWTPKGVVSPAVRSPVRLSEEALLSPP